MSLVATVAMVAASLLAAADEAYGSDPTPAPTAAPSTPSTTPFPPTAPGGLHTTAVTAASVTLAWTASTAGCCPVSGYQITYSRAFNDVIWQQAVGAVTTATITSDISPASQYSFQVAALDDLGHRSALSNAVTVVTPLSDTGPDTVPPSAPSGLHATGATLTWSPATDNVAVTGYNVYRFDGLFISTLLSTVTATQYTVPAAGARDVFYVRARDAAGNVSIASNIVPVTPITPTPSPSACQVTYTTNSQWAGGFVAAVTILNTGTTPLTGWTLAFTFGGDQRITNSWNATFTQSGTAVTMRHADYNGVINAGGQASFGIQGTWTASDAQPAAFTCRTGA